MPKTAVPDWAAIRHAYEETDAAVAAIADAASIAQSELEKARKREGWIRHKPRGLAPGRQPAAVAVAAAAAVVSEAAAPALPRKSTPKSKPTAKAPATATVPATPAKLAPKPKRPAPTGTAHRRRLLDRLVAAISLKLSQLERRMSHDLESLEPGDPATATDHERETRAIGALIDNLGKVTEMETGLDRATAGGGKSGVSNLADEAERCRRELAERLSRLVEAAAKDA